MRWKGAPPRLEPDTAVGRTAGEGLLPSLPRAGRGRSQVRVSACFTAGPLASPHGPAQSPDVDGSAHRLRLERKQTLRSEDGFWLRRVGRWHVFHVLGATPGRCLKRRQSGLPPGAAATRSPKWVQSGGITAAYRNDRGLPVEVLVTSACAGNGPEHQMQRSELDPKYGVPSQYCGDGASQLTDAQTSWQTHKKHPGPKAEVLFGSWRWGELNPRPMSCCQGFSGRSSRRIFSAPAIM